VTAIIAIVDDDEAIRISLSSVLRTYGYQTVVFGDATSALDGLRRDKPDCIVLDVRMPGMDGLTAQRVIAEDPTLPPVIVITGHADIPMAVRAMKNGAFDFIEKPIDDELLAKSIAAAVASHSNMSTSEPQHSVLMARFEQLTNREKTVASLVSDGYSTAAIAATLEISGRTVDHHRANVLAKMQATSLPQLLRFLLALSRRPK